MILVLVFILKLISDPYKTVKMIINNLKSHVFKPNFDQIVRKKNDNSISLTYKHT